MVYNHLPILAAQTLSPSHSERIVTIAESLIGAEPKGDPSARLHTRNPIGFKRPAVGITTPSGRYSHAPIS